MKFKTSKKNIVAALRKIRDIAGKPHTCLPILTTALMESEKGKIKLIATDLEMVLETFFEADIQKEGAICVPVKLLNEITRELAEGETISFEANDTLVKIASGKSSFNLNILPASEFPKTPGIDVAKGGLVITGRQLHEMLEQVIFAASTDIQQRFNLCSVLFNGGDGNQLVLAATDGHRLAVSGGAYAGIKGKYIVPIKAVREMVRFSADAGDEPVNVSVSERFIRMSYDVAVFNARLIDADYPDYGVFLGNVKGYTNKIIVNRDALTASLSRVMLLTEEKVCPIRFSIEGKTCALKGRSSGLGEAVDVVEAQSHNGPDAAIGVNGKYAKEGISALPGENVVIGIGDELEPISVSSEGINTTLQIIMPMRLEDADTSNIAVSEKSEEGEQKEAA